MNTTATRLDPIIMTTGYNTTTRKRISPVSFTGSNIIPLTNQKKLTKLKDKSKIINAYGYVRISTLTQEDGMGREIQDAGITQYCEEQGIHLVKTFVETTTGASKDEFDFTKREEFLQMLGLIGIGGDVSLIIVYNTARLWRSEKSASLVKEKIKQLGCDVKSCQQTSYTLYPQGASQKFSLNIGELIDVYERDTIVEKLATGRTAKARKGDKPAGLLPFGYQYAYSRKSVLKKPEEEPIVDLIFSFYKQGIGYTRIARELNFRELKTRTNHVWTKQSISYILTNDFYTGILTHQGDKIVGHQPIYISYEEWFRIFNRGEKVCASD